MPRRSHLIVLLVATLGLTAPTHAQREAAVPISRITGPITVALDARETTRKLLHTRLTMPVTPGSLTLVYPKWLPGEHAPDGPIDDMVGLTFTAEGKTLAWRRDPIDVFAFHLDIPAGVTTLDVSFDFLSAIGTTGYSSSTIDTAHLAVFYWNQVLLYPAGARTDDVTFRARVQLPAGWKFATALPIAGQSGAEVQFSPVSLTTLVDSPVMAGEYFRAVPLDASSRPVEFDIAGDSQGAVAITPELTGKLKRLVREADALFGARHFDSYHFLVSLSDRVAHFGLEHHQSTDSHVPERAIIDQEPAIGVVAHEFVHSWNGKYRRPAGLATPDFQQPMIGDLLWVYEGLTQYLGYVLAVRSGLWTEQYYKERLAYHAAYLDHEPGRDWRPLVDTGLSAQFLYFAPLQWASYRRSVDFYDEGWLIWLDVDTQIRQLTGGTKSIEDFCHLFQGGGSTGPLLRPYTFDDVVTALNTVAAYDWRAFLSARVNEVTPRAPLGGLTNAGWRLVYTDAKNDYVQATYGVDPFFSLGLRIGRDGVVQDVVIGSPADRVGIGAGMQVLAVNGVRWTPDRLRDALTESKTSGHVTLNVQNDDVVKDLTLEYRDGIREPHLDRIGGTPDVLARILAPHAR